MLSTPWSRQMGLRLPVVNAPMGGVAGGRLAAAVTAGGGLGMIGMGSSGSAPALRRELGILGRVTPFGVGLVDWVVRRDPALLDAALDAQPTMVAVSFGADWTWVRRAHQAGVLAAVQVADSDEARRAEDAGVDVLVARGAEGGGHGDPRIGTLPLLDAVLDKVSAPVLAAGGIASPRSLAAVLAAGASGAWLGTCLTVCTEALTSKASRRAVLEAREGDTVTTRAFDVGLGYAWPRRFPERVLRNDFTERWDGREDDLVADDSARAALAAAVTDDDRRVAPVDAGQGVELVSRSRPVGEVLDEMCSGAARLLDAWRAGARSS